MTGNIFNKSPFLIEAQVSEFFLAFEETGAYTGIFQF